MAFRHKSTPLQELEKVYNSLLMTGNRDKSDTRACASEEPCADTPGLSSDHLISAAEEYGLARPHHAQPEKLRILFPDLPENELKAVAETFHRYCTSAWRIYERIQRERPEAIDELMRARTMKGKVDSSK